MCTYNYVPTIYRGHRRIHVSPAFHAKASTYPALPCVKHCGIVAQHKIIESLPKQRTKYSDSQGTLSKTILSSLHDLPTKIALPTKLSPLPCSGTMSSSDAANCPKAYWILKRFKVQPCKLRSNPVTSHHFLWCSTDLSPDPSTFDTTSPRRSASLHPPDLNSLITNWVAVEVKCCDGFVDAQRIGQDLEEMVSRASSGWLVAKQKPKISEGAFWYLMGSWWSIWQSCSRILQTLREKKHCRLQNEIQNVHPIRGAMRKKVGGLQRKISDPILCLSSL